MSPESTSGFTNDWFRPYAIFGQSRTMRTLPGFTTHWGGHTRGFDGWPPRWRQEIFPRAGSLSDSAAATLGRRRCPTPPPPLQMFSPPSTTSAGLPVTDKIIPWGQKSR